MHINQLGNGTVKYIIFKDLLSNYKKYFVLTYADITYIRRELNKEYGKLYKKGNC